MDNAIAILIILFVVFLIGPIEILNAIIGFGTLLLGFIAIIVATILGALYDVCFVVIPGNLRKLVRGEDQ